MQKEFAVPSYQHDKALYEAICRWLKRTPLTFSNKTLPEFLYRNIAIGFAQKEGEWRFDQQKSAGIIIDLINKIPGQHLMAEEFPPAGLELLMKHLYIGMLEAALDEGCSQFPRGFNISDKYKYFGIGVADKNVLFILGPDIAKIVRDLDAAQQSPAKMLPAGHTLKDMLRNTEDNGYKYQCAAHYYGTHRENWYQPQFLADVDAFMKEQEQKRAARHRDSYIAN